MSTPSNLLHPTTPPDISSVSKASSRHQLRTWPASSETTATETTGSMSPAIISRSTGNASPSHRWPTSRTDPWPSCNFSQDNHRRSDRSSLRDAPRRSQSRPSVAHHIDHVLDRDRSPSSCRRRRPGHADRYFTIYNFWKFVNPPNDRTNSRCCRPARCYARRCRLSVGPSPAANPAVCIRGISWSLPPGAGPLSAAVPATPLHVCSVRRLLPGAAGSAALAPLC